MYTRMATMVAEQGEILERIDDHMDIAYGRLRLLVLCRWGNLRMMTDGTDRMRASCVFNQPTRAENVRDAESELLKYYNMAKGNRSLILKIFFILLLMIFLFVVVF